MEGNLKEEKKKSRALEEKIKEIELKCQQITFSFEDLQLSHKEKIEENKRIMSDLDLFKEEKEELESAFKEKEAIFIKGQEQLDRFSLENTYLTKALEEKEQTIKNQYKETEKLQKTLQISTEKAEKLQNDLFISQKNFSDFELSSKENIKLMKQNLEMITFENQNLNQRLNALQKENLEKYEEEKRVSSDLKKELYVMELKSREKDEKIFGIEKILSRNEEILKDTEGRMKSLGDKLSKTESALRQKEEEKQRLVSQGKQLKRRFLFILKEKFQDVRSLLSRFSNNTETLILEYKTLTLQHLSYLPNHVQQFLRTHNMSNKEEREQLIEALQAKSKREIMSFQEQASKKENEIKQRYEAQFQEWSTKSLDLTHKMEEIQLAAKKTQGEISSLLREREVNLKELEFLKSELEKSILSRDQFAREKKELLDHQDEIIEERIKSAKTKFLKQEKGFTKSLRKIQSAIGKLQEQNIRNLKEINEGVHVLQNRYDSELKQLNKDMAEKSTKYTERMGSLERALQDFRGKCQDYEGLVKELEGNLGEIQNEKEELILKYDNHIYMLTQNFEDISKTLRQEKERLVKDGTEKGLEIDILKSRCGKLETENKRKDEEIYTLKNQKQKLGQQYEEVLIKERMRNSQCEKEVFEQVQEKKKYEEEVENLQNLLTKKYHKVNEIRRFEDQKSTVNLDEKVKKLHDLDQELKASMRMRTIQSPERGKISTPNLKNKPGFGYSTVTMKKNTGTK